MIHLSSSAIAPIVACLEGDDETILAIVAGVEGPSYRAVGAMMAIRGDQAFVGSLSSGCIESDVAGHAKHALADGLPKNLRYGRGSPFFDIQLPCGGGLEIVVVPKPDKNVLRRAADAHSARRAFSFSVNTTTGVIDVGDIAPTSRKADVLTIAIEPELRFVVFGKGPEASTFAALTAVSDYPTLLLSPDEETRESAKANGCDTRSIGQDAFPDDLEIDTRTAAVLFFHDHEWEAAILKGLVSTNAFYIGAQGSRRTHEARILELEAIGVSQEARGRIRGPIGLVPSARDPRMLAISVLAEVLQVAAGAS